MTRLVRIQSALAAVSILCVLTTSAAAACKPADKSIAGYYQLRGVMETGSTIALAPDGRFRYDLTYGAYDEAAIGCWQRKGGTVTLKVKEMVVNYGNKKFKRLKLKLEDKNTLIRTKMGKEYRYVLVRKF